MNLRSAARGGFPPSFQGTLAHVGAGQASAQIISSLKQFGARHGALEPAVRRAARRPQGLLAVCRRDLELQRRAGAPGIGPPPTQSQMKSPDPFGALSQFMDGELPVLSWLAVLLTSVVTVIQA